MKKFILAAALAGSMVFSNAVYADAAKAMPVAVDNNYYMCAGDQLQLTVYGHDDLSSKPGQNLTPYIVRPDGFFTVPLIGDVDVKGKTVKQIVEELTTRLSEYIVNPMVTINIVKLGTTRVYVLGEINKQGMYDLEKSHNLLDAIAAAGGFTEMSAKKKVFVIRRGEQEAFLKVNLNDLFKKGDRSQNVVLNEGDCVYLTSNGKITFARDIMPFLSGIYMASEVKQNENE